MNNLEDETCSNEKPYVEHYNDTQGRTTEAVQVNETTTIVCAWLLGMITFFTLLSSL